MQPPRVLGGGHTVTVQRIEFLGVHQVLIHELPHPAGDDTSSYLKGSESVRNGRKQQRESKRALPSPQRETEQRKKEKRGKKMA